MLNIRLFVLSLNTWLMGCIDDLLAYFNEFRPTWATASSNKKPTILFVNKSTFVNKQYSRFLIGASHGTGRARARGAVT